MSAPRIVWPDGKAFAFTVFDDTDSQTAQKCRAVYSYLSDLGLRTTKSVWVLPPTEPSTDRGAHCGEPAYLELVRELQAKGFEIGYHMASATTARREQTMRALEIFRQEFGSYPHSAAGHYASCENVYFGAARVSGVNRLAYNLLTGFKNRNRYRGHVPGDPLFWGDLCRQHVKYVRNFTFSDVNTLSACPYMPYYDPERPFVNAWFASTEGAQARSFLDRLSEARQDRLEAEGGACVMYTHFGLGFVDGDTIHPRFKALMARLSRKNGWFVPVTTLLNHLSETKGLHTLQPAERAALERKWLVEKVFSGSA